MTLSTENLRAEPRNGKTQVLPAAKAFASIKRAVESFIAQRAEARRQARFDTIGDRALLRLGVHTDALPPAGRV